MAKKMKLMPLFQELRGREEISSRRPTPGATGLYLMQLRAQNGSTTLPRRRLVISVKPAAKASLPHPVKITHVIPESCSPSPGTRPDRRESSQVPQVRSSVA